MEQARTNERFHNKIYTGFAVGNCCADGRIRCGHHELDNTHTVWEFTIDEFFPLLLLGGMEEQALDHEMMGPYEDGMEWNGPYEEEEESEEGSDTLTPDSQDEEGAELDGPENVDYLAHL